ncbi:MAG TPA: 23S rRNA (pseudouridine(1915)-N(3))-methyltransferase RlmH [Steroidobacteraceae bacterium]
MHVRVIAVGTRMPSWVRTACDEYLARLRGSLSIALKEIPSASRRAGGASRALAREGECLLAALAPAEHVIALDERGREFSTQEFAAWLAARMQLGEDLAFLIGAPDGLAAPVLGRSHFRLSLSRLTLPHALARVLLTEQLYRAHCILANHPYHRD